MERVSVSDGSLARWLAANARMFFHLSSSAEAECLAVDEPEGEAGMAT